MKALILFTLLLILRLPLKAITHCMYGAKFSFENIRIIIIITGKKRKRSQALCHRGKN